MSKVYPLTKTKVDNSSIYVNSVPEDWTIKMLISESNRVEKEGRRDKIPSYKVTADKLELAAFLLYNELMRTK